MSKEKRCDWYLEENLGLSDYIAIDWEVSSKEYVKDASVGDILWDNEEDMLMIVIDIDDDEFTVIKETGCVEFVGNEELEDDCFKKVDFYNLTDDEITLLSKLRKEMKK